MAQILLVGFAKPLTCTSTEINRQIELLEDGRAGVSGIPQDCLLSMKIPIWVCLKIGYIPNEIAI